MTQATHLTLSRTQQRVLLTVERMTRNGDDAHDLEGDLSICSRNLPATEAGLLRRGLIEREFQPEGYGLLEAYYLYRLTDAGREACRDL